jgi:HEAT repeat protein
VVGSEVEALPTLDGTAFRFAGELAGRWWAREAERRRSVAWRSLLLLVESGRGESAVPLLLRLVKPAEGKPPQVGWEPLALLGHIRSRDEAVWAAVAALASAEHPDAWQTLRVLAPQHPERAAEFYRDRMKAATPAARWTAFRALAALDPKAARDALPAAVRAVVVGDAPTPPPAVPRVYTRDAQHFHRGVTDDIVHDNALGLPPMSGPQFNWAALRRLSSDDGAALPFLLVAWKAGFGEALSALGLLGPAAKPAIPDLLLALQQEQITAVDEVLVGLGEDAVAAAARAVRDEKHPKRWACVRFLTRVAPKHPATAEALKAALADRDSGLRVWTVTHIAALPADAAPVAVPLLTAALADADADERVRRRAAEALAKFGPDAKEAVPALAKLLAAHDPATRQMVCETLGRIGPGAKDALPALLAVFEDGPTEVREAAIRACGRIGRDAVGPLIKALKSEKAVVRGSAARALGQVGAAAKQDALPHLLRLRDYDVDPAIRYTAAEAVKRLEVEDRP